MIRIIYRQYNEKTQKWEMNLAFPIYQADFDKINALLEKYKISNAIEKLP